MTAYVMQQDFWPVVMKLLVYKLVYKWYMSLEIIVFSGYQCASIEMSLSLESYPTVALCIAVGMKAAWLLYLRISPFCCCLARKSRFPSSLIVEMRNESIFERCH